MEEEEEQEGLEVLLLKIELEIERLSHFLKASLQYLK